MVSWPPGFKSRTLKIDPRPVPLLLIVFPVGLRVSARQAVPTVNSATSIKARIEFTFFIFASLCRYEYILLFNWQTNTFARNPSYYDHLLQYLNYYLSSF